MNGAGPSSTFRSGGGILDLDNPGQLELLRGVMEGGASLRTVVRGSSMSPFVQDGDVVVIAPAVDSALRAGQIAAVALPGSGRMVVHRLVARRGSGWVVRGDAAAAADGLFPAAAVVGVVVRVERAGRPVALATGVGGACVAALSYAGLLPYLCAPRRLGREPAARALRLAQDRPVFRAAGRWLAPSLRVVAATGADRVAAERRFGFSDLAAPALGGPETTDLVARWRGLVVGFARVGPRFDESTADAVVWLSGLAVWAPFRGMGVGQTLVGEAERRGARLGAREVRARVVRTDARAVAFYRKLGFETCRDGDADAAAENTPDPVLVVVCKRIGAFAAAGDARAEL